MNSRICKPVLSVLALVATVSGVAVVATAQSSRPRRVKQPVTPAEEPLLRPEPKPSPVARGNSNRPLIDVQPVKPVVNTVSAGDTSRAFQLLEQKQFAAAAKEAKAIAAQFP